MISFEPITGVLEVTDCSPVPYGVYAADCSGGIGAGTSLARARLVPLPAASRSTKQVGWFRCPPPVLLPTKNRQGSSPGVQCYARESARVLNGFKLLTGSV